MTTVNISTRRLEISIVIERTKTCLCHRRPFLRNGDEIAEIVEEVMVDDDFIVDRSVLLIEVISQAEDVEAI